MQRYDFKKPYGEFTDTDVYSNTVTYKGNNRIYLDGSDWISGTYAVNAIVSYSDGNVYLKNSTVAAYTNQVPTNASFWTLLGVQYDLFFVTLPYEYWDYQEPYLAGDQIWYKDKTYTAIIGSTNVAPSSTYGSNYWGTGTAYTVTAGTLPTDTTKWTNGDNRNNYLLTIYINIVIMNMMLKIAPKNIPTTRTEAYNKAIDWLTKAASGDVTAELPLLVPDKGTTIEWGSVYKQNNIY